MSMGVSPHGLGAWRGERRSAGPGDRMLSFSLSLLPGCHEGNCSTLSHASCYDGLRPLRPRAKRNPSSLKWPVQVFGHSDGKMTGMPICTHGSLHCMSSREALHPGHFHISWTPCLVLFLGIVHGCSMMLCISWFAAVTSLGI